MVELEIARELDNRHARLTTNISTLATLSLSRSYSFIVVIAIIRSDDLVCEGLVFGVAR